MSFIYSQDGVKMLVLLIKPERGHYNSLLSAYGVGLECKILVQLLTFNLVELIFSALKRILMEAGRHHDEVNFNFGAISAASIVLAMLVFIVNVQSMWLVNSLIWFAIWGQNSKGNYALKEFFTMLDYFLFMVKYREPNLYI